MNKKQPNKTRKPDAEVLRIEGDPLAAFDRMVKAPPPKPAKKREGK